MLSHIRRIEIELFSFCNRKCDWCPNKQIDRQFMKELPEDIFLNLISQLRENNFGIKRRGFISFNRFCEPMSNIKILRKRLEQAKQILPNAGFYINTNGDFLTKENLENLNLAKLQIMDYDCIGKEECIKRLTECGITITDFIENKIIGKHKNIPRVVYISDWPLNAQLEDRAGFLSDKVNFGSFELKWKQDKSIRNYPCTEPSEFVSIDYNGNVTPCCHIRADYEQHADFIFGNIREKSLLEIINSDNWTSFKKLVAKDDYINYPQPCRHCHKIR